MAVIYPLCFTICTLNIQRLHLRAVLHLNGANLSEVSVQNVLALKHEFTALALEELLLEHSHPKLPPLLQFLLRIHGCCRSPRSIPGKTRRGEGHNQDHSMNSCTHVKHSWVD